MLRQVQRDKALLIATNTLHATARFPNLSRATGEGARSRYTFRIVQTVSYHPCMPTSGAGCIGKMALML